MPFFLDLSCCWWCYVMWYSIALGVPYILLRMLCTQCLNLSPAHNLISTSFVSAPSLLCSPFLTWSLLCGSWSPLLCLFALLLSALGFLFSTFLISALCSSADLCSASILSHPVRLHSHPIDGSTFCFDISRILCWCPPSLRSALYNFLLSTLCSLPFALGCWPQYLL